MLQNGVVRSVKIGSTTYVHNDYLLDAMDQRAARHGNDEWMDDKAQQKIDDQKRTIQSLKGQIGQLKKHSYQLDTKAKRKTQRVQLLSKKVPSQRQPSKNRYLRKSGGKEEDDEEEEDDEDEYEPITSPINLSNTPPNTPPGTPPGTPPKTPPPSTIKKTPRKRRSRHSGKKKQKISKSMAHRLRHEAKKLLVNMAAENPQLKVLMVDSLAYESIVGGEDMHRTVELMTKRITEELNAKLDEYMHSAENVRNAIAIKAVMMIGNKQWNARRSMEFANRKKGKKASKAKLVLEVAEKGMYKYIRALFAICVIGYACMCP